MKLFKKVLFLLVLAFLVVGFVACNNNDNKEKEDDKPVVEEHVCKHVCPICGKCTDADCKDAKCADKCQGHEAEQHECAHVCPTCGKCLDPDCTDPACSDKCPGHERAEVKVSSITISGNIKMTIGDTQNLSIEVLPADADNKEVTWKSSDDSILSVNNGKVTAKAVGNAKITATANDGSEVFGSITIAVKEPEKEEPEEIIVVINKSEYYDGDFIDVTEGDELELSYRYEPSDNVLEGVALDISNDSIAYIKDENIVVCQNPGAFVLTVVSSYCDTSCEILVTVNEKHFDPESIEITVPITNIEVNLEMTLVATVSPERAYQKVFWTSSDESVATINYKGEFKALKEGTVVITATSAEVGTLIKEVTITVIPEVPFDRNTFYVSPTNTNNGDTITVDGKEYIVGKNAVTSIDNALKLCNENAVIYVTSGEYPTALNITKPCTLIGPNKDISATATRVDEAIISGLITITASDVTINGFDLEDRAAIRVGGDNCLITNCIIHTSTTKCNGNNRMGCIVDYSPANSGNGDGVDFINDLTVSNCKITVIGQNWSYLTNYMSFTKINNLYVLNNYISNEATSASTASEGIMVYYMKGDCKFIGNTYKYASADGKIIRIAYYSANCPTIEFCDNIVDGRDGYKTGSIELIKASASTVIKIYGNEFYNIDVNTITLGTPNSQTVVDIQYNYFSESMKFAIDTVTSKTTFDHNCYMNELSKTSLGGKDNTLYSTLAELKAAYAAYKEANKPVADTSVIYVDPTCTEDETHFKTIAAGYVVVDEGGKLVLAAGTYAEDIIWSKAVTVVGPNQKLAGTASRNSEAVIKLTSTTNEISANIKFVGVEICGVSSDDVGNNKGIYFATANTVSLLEFENCYIHDMKTAIKIEKGNNLELVITGSKIEKIGQFFIWTVAGVKSVTLYDNYFDASNSGSVVNDAATLIRSRCGNCYIYNNYFKGTPANIGGLFENGSDDGTVNVKFNVFDNCEKFVLDNGNKPVVFDGNLYKDANGLALSLSPSALTMDGVTSDVTLATSEENTKYLYSEFVHPTPAANLFVDASYQAEDATHFKTILSALNAAKAGDIIYVYPGTYSDALTIALNNLTIIGYNYDLELQHTDKFVANNKEHAIISGAITVSSGVSNLKITGFVFKNQLTLEGVANCEISHIVSDSPKYDSGLDGCIRVKGASSDLVIDHFYINGTCPNRGFHINALTTNITVTNCATLDGIDLMYDFLRLTQTSIPAAAGVITFKNNYVTGIRSGLWDMFPYADKYIIENNTFVGLTNPISIKDIADGSTYETEFSIIHNTFDSCGDNANELNVIDVTSGESTKITINYNKFINSFVGVSLFKANLINVRYGLGEIDCSNNFVSSDAHKELVVNATGLTWVETAEVVDNLYLGN